uniref:Uncharacterized protein n=1 Tax=Anopheles melas TaxID=34690 RepID=A0A182TVN6_9DIPT
MPCAVVTGGGGGGGAAAGAGAATGCCITVVVGVMDVWFSCTVGVTTTEGCCCCVVNTTPPLPPPPMTAALPELPPLIVTVFFFEAGEGTDEILPPLVDITIDVVVAVPEEEAAAEAIVPLIGAMVVTIGCCSGVDEADTALLTGFDEGTARWGCASAISCVGVTCVLFSTLFIRLFTQIVLLLCCMVPAFEVAIDEVVVVLIACTLAVGATVAILTIFDSSFAALPNRGSETVYDACPELESFVGSIVIMNDGASCCCTAVPVDADVLEPGVSPAPFDSCGRSIPDVVVGIEILLAAFIASLCCITILAGYSTPPDEWLLAVVSSGGGSSVSIKSSSSMPMPEIFIRLAKSSFPVGVCVLPYDDGELGDVSRSTEAVVVDPIAPVGIGTWLTAGALGVDEGDTKVAPPGAAVSCRFTPPSWFRLMFWFCSPKLACWNWAGSDVVSSCPFSPFGICIWARLPFSCRFCSWATPWLSRCWLMAAVICCGCRWPCSPWICVSGTPWFVFSPEMFCCTRLPWDDTMNYLLGLRLLQLGPRVVYHQARGGQLGRGRPQYQLHPLRRVLLHQHRHLVEQQGLRVNVARRQDDGTVLGRAGGLCRWLLLRSRRLRRRGNHLAVHLGRVRGGTVRLGRCGSGREMHLGSATGAHHRARLRNLKLGRRQLRHHRRQRDGGDRFRLRDDRLRAVHYRCRAVAGHVRRRLVGALLLMVHHGGRRRGG